MIAANITCMLTFIPNSPRAEVMLPDVMPPDVMPNHEMLR